MQQLKALRNKNKIKRELPVEHYKAFLSPLLKKNYDKNSEDQGNSPMSGNGKGSKRDASGYDFAENVALFKIEKQIPAGM